MFFRIFTALFGLFFVSSTIQWLTNPKMAAEGLAMDLVTGMGLNSQIGDFTAFCLRAVCLSADWRCARIA